MVGATVADFCWRARPLFRPGSHPESAQQLAFRTIRAAGTHPGARGRADESTQQLGSYDVGAHHLGVCSQAVAGWLPGGGRAVGQLFDTAQSGHQVRYRASQRAHPGRGAIHPTWWDGPGTNSQPVGRDRAAAHGGGRGHLGEAESGLFLETALVGWQAQHRRIPEDSRGTGGAVLGSGCADASNGQGIASVDLFLPGYGLQGAHPPGHRYPKDVG